jgi:hypothetical protein
MITINSVWFTNNKICVKMSDGQIIETPVTLYPNLSKGTAEQMEKFVIKGGGRWIHWEDLDEDLSVEGFLHHH